MERADRKRAAAEDTAELPSPEAYTSSDVLSGPRLSEVLWDSQHRNPPSMVTTRDSRGGSPAAGSCRAPYKHGLVCPRKQTFKQMLTHLYREESRGSEGWGVPDDRLMGQKQGGLTLLTVDRTSSDMSLPAGCVCHHALASTFTLSWNAGQEGSAAMHPWHHTGPPRVSAQ